MPELPEVEVVRAGIEPAVTGAVIAGVEIFEPRSLRRHGGDPGSFVAALEGQRVQGAVRRGKFLWLPLASGRALVIHLGMSGQVLLRAPGDAGDRMLRIRLHLDHPDHGELWLNFVDQRIFGSMAVDTLLPTADGYAGGFSGDAAASAQWTRLIPAQVAHIARDPLDPAFSPVAVAAALERKNTGIKRALLDQTLVSGIGNIYADEALVEGGTSFDAQYVNVNGESGYFAHSLNAYGQQGNPCPRCGTILVREAFMNRSSHFCPRCQRLR